VGVGLYSVLSQALLACIQLGTRSVMTVALVAVETCGWGAIHEVFGDGGVGGECDTNVDQTRPTDNLVLKFRSLPPYPPC